MNVLIDRGVGERCWNVYDSYGEICVGCGCCSQDPETQARSRLAVSERLLKERLEFDDWFDDPKMRKIQEKNIQSDIIHWRKEIAYYREKLEECLKTN